MDSRPLTPLAPWSSTRSIRARCHDVFRSEVHRWLNAQWWLCYTTSNEAAMVEVCRLADEAGFNCT